MGSTFFTVFSMCQNLPWTVVKIIKSVIFPDKMLFIIECWCEKRKSLMPLMELIWPQGKYHLVVLNLVWPHITFNCLPHYLFLLNHLVFLNNHFHIVTHSPVEVSLSGQWSEMDVCLLGFLFAAFKVPIVGKNFFVGKGLFSIPILKALKCDVTNVLTYISDICSPIILVSSSITSAVL